MRPDLQDSAFPPLLNWLMLAARRQGVLAPAVSHAAAIYHRRACWQADLVRILLPALLTAVVAGGITAAYALTLFVPYVTILHALAR